MEKTFSELEREAYITGNTELANLYFLADETVNNEEIENLQQEITDLKDESYEIESKLDRLKRFIYDL